jgi:hypothetical protein
LCHWTVRSGGEVNLSLNEQSSILVQAQTYNGNYLRGNVEWTIERPNEASTKATGEAIKATYKKGDANVKLFIDSHSIRVTEN